ncbi:MAG: M3 family oligoendopeptidase [Deltaproteobacteria bacterium]|nr:M3 family oligoendopeptidase [Deltaproteobacteria bacterium]
MIVLLSLLACTHTPPAATEADDNLAAAAFLTAHEAALAPTERAMNIAYWEATTLGSEEAYQRAAALELDLRRLYSDPATYQQLVGWQRAGLADPLAARQVELLRLDFEENQGDPALLTRMVELSSKIDRSYNVFRGLVGGAEVNTNAISEVLASSDDSAVRQAHWEASKQVGPVVAEDLRELVRVRNTLAQRLGYPDYYHMRLLQGEQDPAQLQAVLAELDTLSAAPWAQVKGALDDELSVRFGLSAEQLRPWHYADPFFQEAPVTAALDLDGYLADQDILDLSTRYFSAAGLDVSEVLARSDLYPRDGKQPSAFCLDVDRAGDIRVLANIENNEYWMATMLHELGHAMYDRYADPALPYLLRDPAHPFTTEAVAMIFGRQTKQPGWIAQWTGHAPSPEEAALIRDTAQLQQLVFVRWALVMADFERGMYADPEQDLQALWWDRVEHYQGLTRPAGREGQADWATKIHLISAPVYYHNYVLGEMMASQMQAAIARDVYGDTDLVEVDLAKPAVGEWFKTRIFTQGTRQPWSALVEQATGEPLTARYFVEEFLSEG